LQGSAATDLRLRGRFCSSFFLQFMRQWKNY